MNDLQNHSNTISSTRIVEAFNDFKAIPPKEVKKALKEKKPLRTIGTCTLQKIEELPPAKVSKSHIQEALDYFKSHPEEVCESKKVFHCMVRAKALSFARRDQRNGVSQK